jgi:hypothetical protein
VILRAILTVSLLSVAALHAQAAPPGKSQIPSAVPPIPPVPPPVPPSAPAQAAPVVVGTATAEALALVDQQSSDGNLLSSLRQRLISFFEERGEATPEQAAEATDKFIMPEFKAHLAHLKARLARVWTLRFTAAELHELQSSLKSDGSPLDPEQFAASDLGRKYLARRDEIVRESEVEWREWGPPLIQEVFATHLAGLKAVGIDPEKFK